MGICKHGTDLLDSDCINCENEDDEILKSAEKIHDLCLNQKDGEVPTVAEIHDLLKEFVKELAF